MEENNYIDKHVQKGFWPKIDGVAEHTQLLTNLMKDAKRNQRSIVITLLDLKNAFGEINHKLITAALQYHHVPSEISNLIENLYTNCQISIATGTQNTSLINVSKGLLQGDPCSGFISYGNDWERRSHSFFWPWERRSHTYLKDAEQICQVCTKFQSDAFLYVKNY